jgi:hypothetical protein
MLVSAGFEKLPLLIQNEIINYVERNPEVNVEQLVELRTEMYITPQISRQENAGTGWTIIEDRASSTWGSTGRKSETKDETTTQAAERMAGLGNFIVLGETVAVTGLLFMLLLGLGSSLVTLTIYHYRYSIMVRSMEW